MGLEPRTIWRSRPFAALVGLRHRVAAPIWRRVLLRRSFYLGGADDRPVADNLSRLAALRGCRNADPRTCGAFGTRFRPANVVPRDRRGPASPATGGEGRAS